MKKQQTHNSNKKGRKKRKKKEKNAKQPQGGLYATSQVALENARVASTYITLIKGVPGPYAAGNK